MHGPLMGEAVLIMLGCWQPQTQQPTIDRRGKGGWWLRNRRLMGGNATTSRGRQEQEAAARQEAKTEAKMVGVMGNGATGGAGVQ